MAETAKTLSPEKKVLIPDLKAGCSLADSCKGEDFAAFVAAHPGHVVISYVNTTNEIKALTDVVVTSTNAVQIVESFPKDQKIIFGPDRNLGNYINGLTGRDMVLWDGACHVHQDFSLSAILDLKKQHPDAKVISHPECPKPILIVSDHIGSTKSLLDFTVRDTTQTYIVATEWGIIHQMKKQNPSKTFIPAPPETSEGVNCGCNECKYMKLNTLRKVYTALLTEQPEVTLSAENIEKAYKPIRRMLDISAELGL
jgi:quinolinate synthase